MKYSSRGKKCVLTALGDGTVQEGNFAAREGV
jgi:TPP-dependent pyruvate/acetoin dehydrogenase alpha subunit